MENKLESIERKEKEGEKIFDKQHSAWSVHIFN
jgi:hypothetical protein